MILCIVYLNLVVICVLYVASVTQITVTTNFYAAIHSLLPVPQAPAKPPTAPQYSFILPQQGEPFSFAVVR